MGSVGTSTNKAPNTATPQVQPQVVPTQQQAQQANASAFSSTDDGDYEELYNGRQYYQKQTFNIDTALAIQDYLHDQPVAGSLYSPSQELNNAMQKGLKLTPNQQYMVDSLMDGMHPLGQNLTLTHYGRVGYLDSLGALAMAKNGINVSSKNFENMTPAQLAKAFVGVEYTEDKFVSTSYNAFKKAPNGGRPFTDKAVKFNYKAAAGVQSLMPGIGPGGNLGEIILAPGQSYRITGVRFTGKTGRSGSNSYKQIEFDVEVY